MKDIFYSLKRLWYLIKPVHIQVQILSENGQIPTCGYIDDMGLDLYCDQDIIIPPGELGNVPTGIALTVPSGYGLNIRPRSSINREGRLLVLEGTCDANYGGEVFAIVHNISDEPYEIDAGFRIGQAVVERKEYLPMKLVSAIRTPKNSRGDNGFGSTGK